MRHPAPHLDAFSVQSIYFALQEKVDSMNLPECFKEYVALTFSESYDWEYNGITGLPDKKALYLFVWLHDFAWITGAGGKESDVLMKFLIEKELGSKFKSRLYFSLVRIGWFAYFKWKHKFKKNVRKFEPSEKLCFHYAKMFYLRKKKA